MDIYRKTTYLISISTTLLFAICSCSKEENLSNDIQEEIISIQTVTAEFPNHNSEPNTRLQYSEKENGGLYISWKIGDDMEVFNSNTNGHATFKVVAIREDAEGNKYAVFSGNLQSKIGDQLYAYYPNNLSLSEGVISCGLPYDGLIQKENYSHLDSYTYMVAPCITVNSATQSPQFKFTHLMTIVTTQLRLPADKTVIPKKLTIFVNEKNGFYRSRCVKLNDLSTTADIPWTENQSSDSFCIAFSDFSSPTNLLTANCMIFPTNLSGKELTFVLEDTEGVFYKTTRTATDFKRGLRYSTGELKLTAMFGGKNGKTKEEAYLISGLDELQTFSSLSQRGFTAEDKYVIMKENTPIILPVSWQCIKDFKGNFDGNGNKITLSNTQSLFGEINPTTGKRASIKNVIMAGQILFDLDYNESVFFAPLARTCWRTTIENCHNECEITAKVDGSLYTEIGGLILYFRAGSEMTNCENRGKIRSRSSNSRSIIGGLVSSVTRNGEIYTNLFTGCNNKADIICSPLYQAITDITPIIGGIAGVDNFTVYHTCTNQAKIYVDNISINAVSRLGAIVGETEMGSVMYDCCGNTSSDATPSTLWGTYNKNNYSSPFSLTTCNRGHQH